MDLEKLLKRIKAEDVDRKATLETLIRLNTGFVLNIPFETMDMFGGKTKIWDLERIYRIVVDEHRGGFCYDLNGLLQWVLKQFGFKVDLLKAYLCAVRNVKFCETSDHIALMVTLENGEKWLTDVGWGRSCFALPLKMEIGLEQSQPNGIYRLGRMDGKITAEKKKQSYLKIREDIIFENGEQRSAVTESDGGKYEWNVQFGFSEVGCDLEDFQEGYNHAQFKSEFLTANMCVVLQSKRGRKFFFNNLFYEKEYVNPETINLIRFKKCTLDEMYQILEEEFGIKIDYELKLKRFFE